MSKRLKERFSKVISLLLIFNITFSSIFSFPIKVQAEATYVGRITGNDVRLRSEPEKPANNKNNILLELDEGQSVTVLSTNKHSGNGCDAGWYHVAYGNITGYICSTYVHVDNYDVYDRPWTSPKKAIIGGAKFVAGSYISRGQFTSYLKKFNVNPDGYYKIYNHLYMSNLAAPSSEARTSYDAYKNNGLFDLPLAFNIPVYYKMEDSYDRPGGNLTTVEKQTNVTDQVFEDELNRQGFPESYKAPLRALHAKHPNWTFTAMDTDIKFSVAVWNFKNVGAIQGDTKYYDEMSKSECKELYNGEYKNGYCQSEANWYIPNSETTAYYVDPRNFLTEKYILQFESLENSSNYTESVVQNILKGTFMEGISILDNQSYASIFVEAGSTANVSAVYLASLARQESGTNGSMATSGNSFDYEGETYQGLFNFFNIGAKSSASSPVKAGLVYASGGLCTICSNGESQGSTSTPSTNPGESINVPQTENTLETSIKEAGYKIDGDYVIGFDIGEKVDSVKDNLKNSAIEIKSDNKRIGTGDKISFNGKTYTVVVYGDLTGDGEVSIADLVKVRQYLLGKTSLSGAYKESANVDDKSGISIADLVKIRQYLLGKTKISQS